MQDIRIRFRHLRSFLTIARLKSVGRAAEALAVTQPALSKTLRELEQALQVRLFVRGSKGMELTRIGHMFLQRAGASLASLQQGIEEVRAVTGAGAGVLSMGVMPNVAPRVIPLAFQQFREAQPKISVHIAGGSNTRLVNMLRVGELELVVGRLGLPESMLDLTFEHLYSESLTIVARPGHKLVNRRSVGPKMLTAYPWIVPEPATIIGHEVNRYLIGHGVWPSAGQVETIAVDFGRGYCRLTDAVWFVPRGAVETDLEDGILAELPIDTRELKGPVGITTRVAGTANPAAATMIEAVRAVCRAIHGPAPAQAGPLETKTPNLKRRRARPRGHLRR